MRNDDYNNKIVITKITVALPISYDCCDMVCVWKMEIVYIAICTHTQNTKTLEY